MTKPTVTDLLGIAAVVRELSGWVLVFTTVLILGDCGGCVDVAEIIRATRGER